MRTPGTADFSLCAWVDESVAIASGLDGRYVLAAVVADPMNCAGIRDRFIALRRGKEPRLHWRAERSQRRSQVAMTIADSDVAGIAVVGAPVPRTGQERARRRCLERLLYELDRYGATQVVLESRSARLNQADLRLIDSARRKHVVPPGMRIEFGRPSDEPMLWLPDAVAGAVRAAELGESSWLRLMDDVITVHRLDLA